MHIRLIIGSQGKSQKVIKELINLECDKLNRIISNGVFSEYIITK